MYEMGDGGEDWFDDLGVELDSSLKIDKTEAWGELFRSIDSLMTIATLLLTLTNKDADYSKFMDAYYKFRARFEKHGVKDKFHQVSQYYKGIIKEDEIEQLQHEFKNKWAIINMQFGYIERKEFAPDICVKAIIKLLEEMSEVFKSFKRHAKPKLRTNHFNPITVLERLNIPIVYNKLGKLKGKIRLGIDREDFVRISREILTNSNKYARDGQAIVEVYINVEDSLLLITFKDYGIGIEPEDLEKLQTSLNEKKKHRVNGEINGDGQGLLFISELCILEIFSEGLDHGTAVTIKIPVETKET